MLEAYGDEIRKERFVMRKSIKLAVVLTVVGALVFSGLAWGLAPGEGEEEGADRRVAFLTEQLAPLVDDGTISAEQAEEVAAYIVENVLPPERPRRVLAAGHLLRHTVDFLDISGVELREGIAEGDTIAQIAEAKGSSGDALVEYLVEDVEDHLEQAVEAGRIGEDRAAEVLDEAEERITEFVFDTPQPGDRE
jgi:hypothetical protein